MRVAELPLWVRVKRVSLRAQRQHGVDVQRRLTALRTEDEGIYALRFQFCQIAQTAEEGGGIRICRDDVAGSLLMHLIGSVYNSQNDPAVLLLLHRCRKCKLVYSPCGAARTFIHFFAQLAGSRRSRGDKCPFMLMISGQLGVNTGDRTLTDGIYILLFTSFAIFIAACADGGSGTIRSATKGSPFSAFCGHLRTAADLDLCALRITAASTNAASISAAHGIDNTAEDTNGRFIRAVRGAANACNGIVINKCRSYPAVQGW